jgi:hypothetical protein
MAWTLPTLRHGPIHPEEYNCTALHAMVSLLVVQSEGPASLPAYAAEAKRQELINRSYPYVVSQGHVTRLICATSTLDTSSTVQY